MIPFAILLAQRDQGREIFVQVTSPGFIGTIIIGLLAGWIAGTISRGRGYGCIVDIILGLIGAFVGRWIFTRLGIVVWGFWGTLAAATVGAVVLVAVARLIAGGRD
ncbi:MAG TPA: GlsB/YeaQ/YmgE family stress response membrane protein [Candidatus Sulfotelmatobacter sp.]|nr:GlsB/YeaQ/YmgE family stress response membrane protein [Candidatus Sulfotelmatobacter sp.]